MKSAGTAQYLDLFQFTPLREGRPKARALADLEVLFQFTPLREGRLSHKFAKALFHDFNSRPSARGDEPGEWVFTLKNISIHAPPRGATCRRSGIIVYTIFQFTPLREGRRDGRRGGKTIAYFNSRPSARGDLADLVMAKRGLISIHAPPRGATISGLMPLWKSITFQFTPLREGRPKSRGA